MQQAAGICDYHKKKYKINCLLRLQHVEQLVELSKEKNIRKQKTRNQNKLTETGKKNSWRAQCAWNIYNLNMLEQATDIEWCRPVLSGVQRCQWKSLSFK